MDKKIDWLAGFKDCYECQQQGHGIVQSIVYALLVFCVLGTVYACFEKIEPESAFSAAAEAEDLNLENDI